MVGPARRLTLSLARTQAWDAKVDDPTPRGSRQGRAERSSVTNFARLCERRARLNPECLKYRYSVYTLDREIIKKNTVKDNEVKICILI